MIDSELMKKYLLILLISLAYLTTALCQNNIDSLSNPKTVMLFSHSSTSFSLVTYVDNKARVTRVSGKYYLKAPYMIGAEGGIEHYFNFWEKYSLIIGFHAGAAARNYDLRISKSDFTPNLNLMCKNMVIQHGNSFFI